MKLENLKGRRFQRLVVLDRSDNNKNGAPRWTCVCDCGTVIVALASDLKREGRPSCGCLKREKLSNSRKLPLGEGAANNMYAQYRKSAKQRIIAFELTRDKFRSLIDKNCHYCGIGPTQHSYGMVRMATKNVNGNFKYTGIDRKNNEMGYTEENCVTCCKSCNYAKHNTNYEQFISYLNRLVAFRSSTLGQ